MARIPKDVLEHFRRVPLFEQVSDKGLRAVVSAADELDEQTFASWLGVSPAGYTRYVDRGLGALAGYLAQHRSDDDQTRPA